MSLLNCVSSLYILDINPLSDIWFANTISHSVDCLFVLLMVSCPSPAQGFSPAGAPTSSPPCPCPPQGLLSQYCCLITRIWAAPAGSFSNFISWEKASKYLQGFSRAGGTFPGGTSHKEPAFQCRRHKRCRFDPWIREIPWRRAWQPTLIFLPGESHGQRSLVGYSPWSCRVRHDWSDLACTHSRAETSGLLWVKQNPLQTLHLLEMRESGREEAQPSGCREDGPRSWWWAPAVKKMKEDIEKEGRQ